MASGPRSAWFAVGWIAVGMLVMQLVPVVRAEPPHVVAAADLGLSRCVAALADGAAAAARNCRGFLIAPLAAAREACRTAGGDLAAATMPNVWAVDVNGDGRDEYAFDYDGIAVCTGAASAFSCGSLGCPKELYEERGGAWVQLGEIYADSPDALEVLAAARGGYRDLRVGCGAVEPCNERWHYVWRGDHYERDELEARGYRVAFADSVHGLRAADGDLAVLAAPKRDAAVLEVYPPRTELAIVGTVVDADYYYVSPCNACESGFVPKSALQRE
jgi:hypothetical protein